MPLNSTFANDLLKLILQAIPIAGLADNAATAPLTTLYIALHTADPGAGGSQTTSELAYTQYARMPVVRSALGWTVTGNAASPVTHVEFAEMLAGAGGNVTWISVGTAATGAGKVLIRGPITPNIAVAVGITPRVKAGTAITFLTS